MGKKKRDKKPESEERIALLLASMIRRGAWGQIQGLPVTMQLLCFPWQTVIQLGKGIIPSAFQLWGSQEQFPARCVEARLPDLRAMEGARGSSQDPCSLFLNPPTHCTLHSLRQCCSHYAEYSKAAPRTLAMVLISRVTLALWPLPGAIWCLVSNLNIQATSRISRDRLWKSPWKSPWGNVIS